MRYFPLLILIAIPLRAEDPPLKFSEHLIADDYQYAYGTAAADLDGDGDRDLVSQSIIGSTPTRSEPTFSSLSWFENDGSGGFRKHLIHEGEPGWFERHYVADMNGDRRLDIAIVNNRDGQIIGFINGADGWKRFVISTQSPRAYDVVLADLDADGDLDAASSGYLSGQFNWFENPGAAAIGDGEWEHRLIDDQMPESRAIGVGDFNGDGKQDLLGAAVGLPNVPADETDVRKHGSSITWYENSGDPKSQSWTKHVIDDRTRAPIHGQSWDMDGDRDLDVVMAHGMRSELAPPDSHHIAWYEKVGFPGAPEEWRKHVVGKLPFAFEAVAGDLDGDGDVDIVATAWSMGDRVVWFENPGDPSAAWAQHVIRKDWPSANQAILADIDGDGRLDIIATADNGSSRIQYKGANELRWWRNEGRQAR